MKDYIGRSLHSTMYLLICGGSTLSISSSNFTFHYVSINITDDNEVSGGYTVFTFHYVSINIFIERLSCYVASTFTFHYVSINIEKRERD